MSPTVNLRYCSFNKDTKTLTVASEFFGGVFPPEVVISSHYSNKTVRFIKDQEAAIANEFWDGEMCEYRPIDDAGNCERLVLIHEY